MLKTTLQLSFILLILIMTSCTNQKTMEEIRTGDILFRGNTNAGLSKAISKVTQTSRSTNYSHIGICQVLNDTVWVYHAAPEKGVCKELLNDFLSPNGETNYTTDLYRVKDSVNISATDAIGKASKYLGQNYDYTYILESPGFYCSEYIYDIFKESQVFKLNPMTFKNPDSEEFNTTWIEHYKLQGIEIPEGKLGCNPNGMAASNNILFVTNIQ